MDTQPVINLNSLISRTASVMFTQVDRDKVMMDMEQESYFGLNVVASVIWDLLEEPATPAKLCTALLERFEVDQETCQRETLAVLERMNRLGIIKVAGETSA